MSTIPRVILFTDGSAKTLGPNGDTNGGWAYILRWNESEMTQSGAESYTSINRMELKAILEGMRQLVTGCEIELYSDSQYALSMITNIKLKWFNLPIEQWRVHSGKPPLNLDILTELYTIIKKYHHHVHTHWVKSHAPISAGGHELNARCDEMAYGAMAELCKSQGRAISRPRKEKEFWRSKNFKKKKKKRWKHNHAAKVYRNEFDSTNLF